MKKTRFVIQIAERNIEINVPDGRTYSTCDGYIALCDPEIVVSVRELDIQQEAKGLSLDMDNDSLFNWEPFAVYRKVCESLLSFSTFLMHGAVIAVDDCTSFMFTAESGIGKTTHIRKWLKNAPKAFVVNGDKPLIKVTGTEAIAYGTPWCGKEHLNTNIGVPLRAIVLMERSEDNVIEEISFSKAFPTLLQQTYRPADADKMRKTLSLLSALNGKMKFYRFRFNNMKPDAFRVSYEALTGQKLY